MGQRYMIFLNFYTDKNKKRKDCFRYCLIPVFSQMFYGRKYNVNNDVLMPFFNNVYLF